MKIITLRKAVCTVLAFACLFTALTLQTGCQNSGNENPMRDISSVELIKEMKIGWNLGNTLDAGYKGLNGSSPSTIETSWGCPVTTKEMVDMVKEAGFNVFRVPVTWDWSTGEAPDYIISEEWMNRVQEVVDYGIDNDMFVIVNLHHETWHSPTEENYPAASERLKKVWTQIGERFADYDEHLIFEGMNEPRVIGSAEEWTGGTDETRSIINKLNADFVSTIRSLGGNNELRHLMIPAYAASSSEAAIKQLEFLENDDKIIASVHAYLPYSFALAPGNGGGRWFASKAASTKEIDTLAKTLKENFVDKGRAVIIGEFGARSRDNEKYRVLWAKYYVTKMKELGIPCIWWDNNAFSGSGELFGLLDRRNLTWKYPDLLNAVITAANGDYTIEQLISESEAAYESERKN